VESLKQWLLEYYSATAFNTCENQPLPLMTGEPLALHIDPEARPIAVHKPALVPIHWQEKVKADLERDIKIGVLERVDQNTPVTWCSRMVVTAKADGTPRRTVDLQPLNKHSVRQTHHVPTPFHLADRIPQGTKKTVTDAWNGYHSVPIRDEDKHVTTFITPWGRFRYRVAPQGFIASGDAYNQRFDAIIASFPNQVKCVDDTCMWSNSIEEAFFQACDWLDLCARNGITLNPRKFQFAQDTVEFAGLSVTPTSICPSEKFLNAIRLFPTPKDISGARGWFGLINQGSYAFSMTKRMSPFRHLLKPSTTFSWTPELEMLFQQSKEVIIEEMKKGVRLFDPNRQTCLSTDWSVSGIGFCLLQKYCTCPESTPACCRDGWKLCLVGSRFATPAETRYSPIEGEALAVAYSLHQTRYYVLGCKDLIVATDHKPLLQILNDRALTEIHNRRLLNLKEKTLMFRYKVVHVPGKRNSGADAASRNPVDNNSNTMTGVLLDDDISIDELAEVTANIAALNVVNPTITWDMVRTATASDPTSLSIMNFIQTGFPEDCRQLPPDLRPYHRLAQSLYTLDGVILLGQRIVIPSSLRPSMLEALHSGHQGVNAMRSRAQDSIYWPNITVDIARVRDHCAHCHRMAKSNARQPPSDPAQPEYPFQMVCSDYLTHGGRDYLVVVDRYSNWPIAYRSEGGAEGLIRNLRNMFSTFGIPENITSDGGPQFTAGKTQEFLRSWGVTHRLSSVGNPHANCRAELAVKTVKRLLTDNISPTGSLDVDKFQKAILLYRNTVDPETKSSPALAVFGRPIRDMIPIIPGRYVPHETWRELMGHRELALAKRHSRGHERWNEHTRQLPPLKIGDHVYVQNLTGNFPRRWERTGLVIEVKQHHQYLIRVDGSGRVTLRNRQHLRKFEPYINAQYGSPQTHDPVAPTHAPTYRQGVIQGAVSPPTNPVMDTPATTATPNPAQGTNISLDNAVAVAVIPPKRNQMDTPDNPTTASKLLPSSPHQAVVSDTQRVTTPSSNTDPKCDTGRSVNTNNTMTLPRALARLQSHNAPGLQEDLPPRRNRRALNDN
jgi:hypothetical protein